MIEFIKLKQYMVKLCCICVTISIETRMMKIQVEENKVYVIRQFHN